MKYGVVPAFIGLLILAACSATRQATAGCRQNHQSIRVIDHDAGASITALPVSYPSKPDIPSATARGMRPGEDG